MFLDEPEVPDPGVVTGTMIDEFLPIYRALAQATDRRRGFSQDEVDRMDLTVVAMHLGVGAPDPMLADMAEQAELVRRRRAGEDVNWDDVVA